MPADELAAAVPDEPNPNDAKNTTDMDDMDVEAALLALSEDMGAGPTQDVDLSALSPTERQALLRYLRERLGIATLP